MLASGQPLLADRYQLERLLGAGATSEVWSAVDRRLGRTVAVKLLKSRVARELLGERVAREARAAAQLRHPAIVEIYDLGRAPDGAPLIVMEHLAGRTLRQLTDSRGRLAPTDAVALLLPIADALAAAHEAGVVHRDVKPENIFACRLARGIVQPKLVDFGVAHDDRSADARLTMLGTVVGTPTYMAPEQTEGLLDVDGRADVWALGVVLYECVVGRPPFDGAGMAELFTAIREAPLPYPRDCDALDGSLFSLIASATRKQPDERLGAAALTAGLAAWLGERGVATDIAGRSVTSYA